LQEPELSELTKEEAGTTPDRLHLFRLFVGWVSKLFTEQDLLPLFQKVRGSRCMAFQDLYL
jgi:hypothetical protein